MSPTRHVWKPLRANTRTAASRISRRFSSVAIDRSVKSPAGYFVPMQPLDGILVVDLTRYSPGAFATRELARLGARVVRLESPDGDAIRITAPEWHDELNAGKESVVCELKAEPELGRA